jgi:hypothetical protein
MQHHVKRTLADGRVIPIPDVSYPGGGGGGGAPDDAEYLVGASDGDLTAERVVTDTPTVTWDLGTAGQAKANVVNGGVLASPDGEYHPDIPPDVMFATESWAGDVASQTWTWQNQGSATETIEFDGMRLTDVDGTNSLRCRFAAILPSTGDFTVCAKVAARMTTSGNSGVHMLVVTNGTLASPTELYNLQFQTASAALKELFYTRWTSYTSGASITGSFGQYGTAGNQQIYLMLQWDDGAGDLFAYVSRDGKEWGNGLSTPGTIVGRPVADSIGFAVRVEGQLRVDWVRVFDSHTFEVGNRP